MVNRLVSVGDDFTLPAGVVVANANLPAHVQPAALTATYVGKQVMAALRRLASVPPASAAFAQDATTLPIISNTNTPAGTLSKSWAPTATGGPIAWHGPLAVRVSGGGLASDLPFGAITAPGISWEWVTDEPLIAINAVFGNGSPHNIYVDDELITVNGAIQGTNSHQVIDWGGVRKMRHYRLDSGNGFALIGIKTTIAGTVIQPAMLHRPLCAFFTDSYGMGGAAVGELTTDLPSTVGRLLNWRMLSGADGGTGWLNNGVSGGFNVASKVPVLNGVKLDAAIFALGINDPDAGLQAQVTSVLNTFAAAHPGVPMYVVGPWQPSTTWANANTTRTAAVKNGALAAGALYVDNNGWIFGTGKVNRLVTDGVTNSTTTITSATAAFTGADIGLVVTGTGIPAGATIVSVTNATTAVLSAAATTTATGVALTVVGNKGDGNADVYIGDGTHLDKAVGNPYMAVRLANEIKNVTATVIGSAA